MNEDVDVRVPDYDGPSARALDSRPDLRRLIASTAARMAAEGRAERMADTLADTGPPLE